MSRLIPTKFYIALVACFLMTVEGYAQFPSSPTTQQDSVIVDSNKIEIIFIRKLKSRETAEGRFQDLIGDVHLRQKAVHMWCDLGFIKPQKMVDAYGNVQLLQDSVRVFSDSLFYDGISRKAKLRKDVVLKDTSMTLFTQKLNYDLNTKIATFPEGSLIESDTVQLVSQKGQYNANTNIAHFTDSVRLTSNNYKLIADSLDFNTQTEIAYFIGPTTVFHEDKSVYCEDGYYDSKNNNAELVKNARFVNNEEGEEEEATGDKIIYKGDENMYYLVGNAHYQNEDQEVFADTILMDGDTEQYYFRGNPIFKSKDSTSNQLINAKNSTYDADTKTMVFRGDVHLEQDNNILDADSLDYSRVNKNGLARGNVVWQDTAADLQIKCQYAIYNDSTKYLKAHGDPLMQTLIDGDSLWLRADTLLSVPADTFAQDSLRQDTTQSDGRSLFAYHHVRMYKKDLQVLCDSLHYNSVDSSFSFYEDPLLWVDETQFSADTIRVSMKNDDIDKVYLNKNSFIINTEEKKYFNQVKGIDITTLFRQGAIHRMAVKTGGETVYYAKDDKDYFLGVDDIDCQDMLLFFDSNQIQKIRFEGNPKAVLYPMHQVNHTSLLLEGFRWLDSIRPKTKYDIINAVSDTSLVTTIEMTDSSSSDAPLVPDTSRPRGKMIEPPENKD